MFPECSTCLRPYEYKNVLRPALLLKCGCTFCSPCLRSFSRLPCNSIKCPYCAVLTPVNPEIKIEDQLPSNIYITGLVTIQEYGLMSLQTSLDSGPKLKCRTPKKIATSLYVEKCSECLTDPASLTCQQCHGNYCSSCSQIIHATSQVLRRHTLLPITQATSVPSQCSIHPSLQRTHYCVEEKEVICHECAQTGRHKNHEVVSIGEAAEGIRADLLPLLGEGKEVIHDMHTASKLIRDDVLPQLRDRALSEMEEFALTLLTICSQLQLRGSLLYGLFAERHNQSVDTYIQAHSCLEEYKDIAMTIINTCKDALKDDFKLVGVAKSLFKDLSDIITIFPSSLTHKTPRDVRIDSDVNHLMNGIKNYGEVQFTQQSSILLSHSKNEATPTISPYIKTPSQSLPKAQSLLETTPTSLPKACPLLEAPPTSLPWLPGIRAKSASPTVKQTKKGRVRSSSHMGRTTPSYRGKSPNTLPTRRGKSPNIVPPTNRGRSPNVTTPLYASPCPSPVDLKEVGVVYVESPEEIYVRGRDQEDKLNQLKLQVGEYCRENHEVYHHEEGEEEGEVVLPKWLLLGVQCGAQRTLDSLWSRGVVEEMTSECVTIFYIDYGYSETLPLSRLCGPLPVSIRIVPPLVSQCCLYKIKPMDTAAGLAPPMWSPVATNLIREETKGTTFMKEFDCTPMCVLYIDLYVGPNRLSLCDKLIKSGRALFCKTRAKISTIPPPFTLAKGDHLNVNILVAENPWDFHILDASLDCTHELDCLSAELGSIEDHHLHVLGAPMTGMWACTRYSMDGRLYRAKIKDLSEVGALVYFVDYGNSELVHLNGLYHLPLHLMSVPAQAVHCRLHGVAPLVGDVWPEKAGDLFNDLVGGYGLVMTVIGDTDKPLKVNLMFRESKENVAELLISNGNARIPATSTPATSTPATSTPASSNRHSEVAALLLGKGAQQDNNGTSSKRSTPTPPQPSTPSTPIPPQPSTPTPPQPSTPTPPQPSTPTPPQPSTPTPPQPSSTPTPPQPYTPPQPSSTPTPPQPYTPSTPPQPYTPTPPHPSTPSTLSPDILVSSPKPTPSSRDTFPLSLVAMPTIPPPTLPCVGESFSCFVVYDMSPIDSVFYVVRLSSGQVEGKYGGTLLEGDVEVGQAALAQYDSQEWHRVVYLGEGSIAKYQVFYVDFGNTGEVDLLGTISPDLCAVPAQAMPCKMEGRSEDNMDLKVVVKEVLANGLLILSYCIEPVHFLLA